MNSSLASQALVCADRCHSVAYAMNRFVSLAAQTELSTIISMSCEISSAVDVKYYLVPCGSCPSSLVELYLLDR